MTVILQINFHYNITLKNKSIEDISDLTHPKNIKETGLVWEIWTYDKVAREIKGVFLFDSENNAKNYLELFSEQLTYSGITSIKTHIFSMNKKL